MMSRLIELAIRSLPEMSGPEEQPTHGTRLARSDGVQMYLRAVLLSSGGWVRHPGS